MSGFSWTLPPGGSGGTGGGSTGALYQAALAPHTGNVHQATVPSLSSNDFRVATILPFDFDSIPGTQIRLAVSGYYDRQDLTTIPGSTSAIAFTWAIWLDSHGNGSPLWSRIWNSPTTESVAAYGSLVAKPTGQRNLVLALDIPTTAADLSHRNPAIWGCVVLLESF